jgi:hypothetical protein
MWVNPWERYKMLHSKQEKGYLIFDRAIGGFCQLPKKEGEAEKELLVFNRGEDVLYWLSTCAKRGLDMNGKGLELRPVPEVI